MEKKERRTNKLTAESGLIFNVNTIKANMKTYFESQQLDQPIFSGSHVAVTGAIQKLCELILRSALQHTTKDKSGMKPVTRQLLKYSVCLNSGLNDYYYMKMLRFDKHQIYADQFPVVKKELDMIITSIDERMILTPKAFNLLTFLLMKAYLDIVSTAYQFMRCAKRKTLDATVVVYAIQNRFTDSIAIDLCSEVSRAMKAIGEEVETINDNEDKDKKINENKNTDDNDESFDEIEDTKINKNKSLKKERKTSIKKSNKKEQKIGENESERNASTKKKSDKKEEKIENINNDDNNDNDDNDNNDDEDDVKSKKEENKEENEEDNEEISGEDYKEIKDKSSDDKKEQVRSSSQKKSHNDKNQAQFQKNRIAIK